MWVTLWELHTPQKIDEIISDAQKFGINQLLVQVRYRGDALYRPNKFRSNFPNNEEQNIYIRNTDFDPLDYILEMTKNTNIEVHAWVTVFVTTPRVLDNLTDKHIFFLKPHWITQDFFGNSFDYSTYEGAYFDPGIPELHTYLINVFLDILDNYPVSGLHLDYIRYPDSKYGFNDISIQNYYDFISNSEHDLDITGWKELQLNRFVKRLYTEVKSYFPDSVLSAAVISNPYIAKERYSQNWPEWINNNYIDYVYLMAYSINNREFENDLEIVKGLTNINQVIVGLRAWSSEGNYPVQLIKDKIEIAKINQFPGFAFFSYSGMRDNNYFSGLRESIAKYQTRILTNPKPKYIIYGYVYGLESQPLVNVRIECRSGNHSYSDHNGFWSFPATGESISVSASYNDIIISSSPLDIEKPVTRYDFFFD